MTCHEYPERAVDTIPFPESPTNSPVSTLRSPRSPGRSDTLSPSMLSPLTPGTGYLSTEEWHMPGFPPQGRSPIYGPDSPGSPRPSPEYARSPRDVSSPPMFSQLTPGTGYLSTEEWRMPGFPPQGRSPIYGPASPGSPRRSPEYAESPRDVSSPPMFSQLTPGTGYLSTEERRMLGSPPQGRSPIYGPASPGSPRRSPEYARSPRDVSSPPMFSQFAPGTGYLSAEEWHMLGFPPQGRSPVYGPASPGSPRRSPEYARSPRDVSSPSMSSPGSGVWTAQERRVLGFSPPPSSHPTPGAHTPRGRRDSSASASSRAQARSPRTPRHQATNHDTPDSPLSSILYELGLPRPDPNDPSSLSTTYDDYPPSPGRWPVEWGSPSFYGLSPSPVPQSPGPSGSQRSSTMSAGSRSPGASSRHGSTSPYLHKARSPTASSAKSPMSR
ncbi:uncharacterized protein C8R40DRAFT_489679 [Lentinula edodes]|uniref:uncharacterized protein n=1 Tax=Lentinula edodes TaxID=5353 RepID=UPI001E8DDC23|nr:uncharacterized protein C8R40DRAFT_489679 [Lentinula edodes]KAH7872528.1 hypothetical protein C8R40DRAFT_489679 [Lentinula edodes]